MPKTDAGGVLRRDVGAVSLEHPSITVVRKLLSVEGKAADRFVESGHALTITSEGFASESWQHPSPTDWSQLGAVLPHRANDFVRVSPVRIERWAVTLEPIGHASVVGQLDAGRVVYEEALPHTDLVATSGDRWMEQVYVLRDAGAPSEVSWKLHLGSDVTARPLTNGEIVFINGRGQATLGIQAPVARDAEGRSLTTTATLDGDLYKVHVDARGAAYPIALDPLVDVPLWTPLGTGAYPPAGKLAGSWSTAEGALVLWSGGGAGATFLPDAYAFNGTSFSALGLQALSGQWGYQPACGQAVTEWTNIYESSYTNGGIVALGGSVTSCFPASSGTQIMSALWGPGGGYGATQVYSFCSVTSGCSVGVPSNSYYFNSSGTLVYNASPTSLGANGSTEGSGGAFIKGFGDIFVGSDGNTYRFFQGPASDIGPEYAGLGSYLNYVPIADKSHVPPLRSGAAMSHDETVNGRAILATGIDASGAILFDMWRFDASAGLGLYWTPVCGALSGFACPYDAREQAQLGFDAAKNKYYLTGGFNAGTGSKNLGDIWEYDDTTSSFVSIAPNGSPATHPPGTGSGTYGLRGAYMGYDKNSKRLILTGGADGPVGSETFYNQTWALTLLGGTCATSSDCDPGATCITEN
ncbi:MAG: hypothetical protein ACHREM_26965, partial [Polyangiales bacterium]